MSICPTISPDALRIDAAAETGRIVAAIRAVVVQQWNRKGAVIGVSGGVDSSVVAFLCARALGKDRVLALLMPEVESSAGSLRLGRKVAEVLNLRTVVEDISPILRAAHYYHRRDQVVRQAVPGYRSDSRFRIVLPSAGCTQGAALFSIVVQSPDGQTAWASLGAEAYQDIVAVTNFKQRTRKMMEYYYADLLEYAVVGTANRLKYDQGLLVKNGDGAADLEPIAHLYKSQIYQLARYLKVPSEIRRRMPTTDAYPLGQPQSDLYLLLELEEMDLCLYGENNGIAASDVARALGLETHQVEQAYDAIQAKRAAAKYLRSSPVLMQDVAAV